MMRTALLVLALAAFAVAGETLTLTFADGRKKTLVLSSFDKAGLLARQGGRELEIAWKALEPDSAFRARKALTAYDDGAARLDLAEFAVTLQLYPQALEELEIALALGGLDDAAFERRDGEIKALEVAFLCKRIDTLLKNGKQPSVCLAAIKRLKERYPEHANNARYQPEIDRLVEILAKQVEKKQADERELKEGVELSGLRKALDKIGRRKIRALDKADKLMKESLPAIAKRQVSRVKRTLVEPSGAERYFKRARKYMRSMANLDRQFRIVNKAQLQKEYATIEKKLIECYLRVARILLKERNYKGTIPYLRKILFYDPIHEEALDMVEEIKKNRISFKASDITNARPRVTGG